MRLAVLASGTGTLLEAILADGLDVVLVVVDRPCRAVEVAEAAGVPVAELLRDSFRKDFDRPAYTERVVAALREADVDLVVVGRDAFRLWVPEAFYVRGVNTRPLGDGTTWVAPALDPARRAAQELVGRPVHIQAMARWFLERIE